MTDELESATCICTGREGFHPAKDDPDFWVCAACEKPKKMYLDAYFARLIQ